MIYIEQVDPAELVLAADHRKQEILSRNFAEISLAEATKAETLDPMYEPVGFLKELQDDFYNTLMALWDRGTRRRGRFVEEYKLPPLDPRDMAALEKAYKSASRRSLWEKVTKTNYKDIVEYKGLLRQSAEKMLNEMQDNFGDALFRNR